MVTGSGAKRSIRAGRGIQRGVSERDRYSEDSVQHILPRGHKHVHTSPTPLRANVSQRPQHLWRNGVDSNLGSWSFVQAIYKYVRLYICICTCIHICIYIYICIYIHVRILPLSGQYLGKETSAGARLHHDKAAHILSRRSSPSPGPRRFALSSRLRPSLAIRRGD